MNFRPVLYVLGIALCVLSAGMALPLLMDFHDSNPGWKVFFFCMVFTAFFGGLTTLSNADGISRLTHKQGLVMLVLCWVVLPLFAALPFLFSDMGLSFTDSFFESVSGITATGATILSKLDSAPRGILLWRALLQWLGGFGAIVMAVSVLPLLKVGGMQVSSAESPANEKVIFRKAHMISALGGVYLLLTVANTLAYKVAGMGPFDAFAHALTTISSGGFSTHDASLTGYDSLWIEIVAIIFMIIGCLPFVAYLKIMRGNSIPLLTDSQIRFFLSLILICTGVLTARLILVHDVNAYQAFMSALFNVVSVLTGTGFMDGSYAALGEFSAALLFFMVTVGGCAGSTAGGIKVFRFQVLYSVSSTQIKELIYPRGVFIPGYNRKTMPEGVAVSVMAFFFLYALGFLMIASALSCTGIDFMTALSGSATSLSNAGPVLGGIIGPAGTYASLPDSAKWILSGAMILGRLELLPVIAFLSLQFCRN